MRDVMLCIFLFFFLENSLAHVLSPVVQTRYGKVQGIVKTLDSGSRVDAFLGVPFAAPPVGRDRFSPPKAPTPWSDVLQVRAFSDICYQAASDQDKNSVWFISKARENEDCLYLNLWRPQNASDLAVMVWIHGGGLFAGTAMDELYDGSILAADQNLVVVSFNYRMNLFGMMYLGLPEMPGNVLLQDQIHALEWVRDNVRFFGGNPNKVTIFGESAGAWSVGYHLLNPSVHSLFRNAIIESGTPNFPGIVFDEQDLLKRTLGVAKTVGCPTSEDRREILNCLLGKNASELISHYKYLPYNLNFVFVLLGNGKEVPKDVATAAGKLPLAQRKPLLLGTNGDEMGYFTELYYFPNKTFDDNTILTERDWYRLLELFGIRDERLKRIVTLPYRGRDYDPEQVRREATSFMSDVAFVCPLVDFSTQYARDASKTYLYSFMYQSAKTVAPKTNWAGVQHGEELPFVFGAPLRKNNGYTNTDAAVSRMIMAYWGQFAKTGNPNGDRRAGPQWPPFDSDKEEYLELNKRTMAKRALRGGECSYWGSVYPDLLSLQEDLSKAL